ncbi:hypothetical protein GCM10010289_39670 [Streptomyces violascens]|uniref:Uncharacterized protein n=1 Tax=Streptomyces violascens TaxID=67381 RepID=A0ABQ3R072_9ACTN|nr:hypothetical protein GCM10010289_39670 [Streptomyces violascens]GHI42929.1 hypothetical protein Sviol_73370 [Streptomyces violascens]
MQDRRDLCARLNTTARAYRVAARDAVHAAARHESAEPAALDASKEAWAEEYSQAGQMALPKDVLEVASTLNRALGVGYAVVKAVAREPGPLQGIQPGKDLVQRTAVRRGVPTLRVALRHDLGVETEPDFEQTRGPAPNPASSSAEREKAPHRDPLIRTWCGAFPTICSAASYSPTGSPLQYHRR